MNSNRASIWVYDDKMEDLEKASASLAEKCWKGIYMHNEAA